MRKFASSFFSLLLALGPSVRAAETHRQARIYDEVVTRCWGDRNFMRDFTERMNHNLGTALETAKIGLLEMGAVAEMIENQGLSASLREKLESEAFYQALDVCFERAPHLKSVYVLSLIGQEAGARLSGATIAALLFVLPVKFLTATRMALAATPAVWARLSAYVMDASFVSLTYLMTTELFQTGLETYNRIAQELDPTREIQFALQATLDERYQAVLQNVGAQSRALKIKLKGRIRLEERARLQAKLRDLNQIAALLHEP